MGGGVGGTNWKTSLKFTLAPKQIATCVRVFIISRPTRVFGIYSSNLYGHEKAGDERIWPHRQSGESRIESKQNASPVPCTFDPQ
jgi:hypothetical protein